MSLDIRFDEVAPECCPHCGEVIGSKVIDSADECGNKWYGLLEAIGYYVPVEQRTEENDWYGKDMTLNREQAEEAYKFAKLISQRVASLIANACMDGHDVVVNADW